MWLVYRQRRSVAVADVPDLELSHVLGFDASTDALTASGLASQLLHVGCHCCLTGGVVGSGLVNQESAVVLFDHALSIGLWGRSGENGGQFSNRTPDQRWRWC